MTAYVQKNGKKFSHKKNVLKFLKFNTKPPIELSIITIIKSEIRAFQCVEQTKIEVEKKYEEIFEKLAREMNTPRAMHTQ